MEKKKSTKKLHSRKEKIEFLGKLLKIYSKCDEETKVVGKCPSCGSDMIGSKFTKGEYKGHGGLKCTNSECPVAIRV